MLDGWEVCACGWKTHSHALAQKHALPGRVALALVIGCKKNE
jgi:hypothetical protein